MHVAILGNSGSGKSTLAKRIAGLSDAALLDLDTIAWEPGKVAVPRDPARAAADLNAFCEVQRNWVIEGCYAGLIRESLTYHPYLVFLDPGAEQCIANCKARRWEPHKYSSKTEQDAGLSFLLQWVAEYYTRDGDMSWQEHLRLYEGYHGPKLHLRQLPDEGFVLPGQAPPG